MSDEKKFPPSHWLLVQLIVSLALLIPATIEMIEIGAWWSLAVAVGVVSFLVIGRGRLT